jgi:hypothetical protein
MKGISKELQKLIPEFKAGETYEFELLNLKTTKLSNGRSGKLVPSRVIIPSSCSIKDPGTNETITINYVDIVLPSTAKSDERVKLGRVEFVKSEKGRKILRGNNGKDKDLFEYLYLCAWGKHSEGQPWHYEPKNGAYKFKFVDRANLKKNEIEKKRKRHAAISIALDLSDKDMRILCEKLQSDKNIDPPFVYSEKWLEDDLRDRLVNFAEKNPGKVIDKHEQYNLAIENLVRDALKAEIIIHDKPKKQVIWGTGQGLLVTVPKGKQVKDILATYFMTEEGKNDLEAIVAQLKGDNVPESTE